MDPKKFDWDGFINFRIMIVPMIIKWVFLIGTGLIWILCIIGFMSGFFSIISGSINGLIAVGAALIWFVIGPVALRVWCEMLAVAFSINDNLNDIRKHLIGAESETET